jgi:hypothetical protein
MPLMNASRSRRQVLHRRVTLALEYLHAQNTVYRSVVPGYLHAQNIIYCNVVPGYLHNQNITYRSRSHGYVHAQNIIYRSLEIEAAEQTGAAAGVFGSAPTKAVPVNEADRAKGTKRGRDDEEEEEEDSENEDAEPRYLLDRHSYLEFAVFD